MKTERSKYIHNSTRKMYMPIIVNEYCKYWEKWHFYFNERKMFYRLKNHFEQKL